MENENKDRSSTGKLLLTAFAVLIILFMIYFTVMSALAPGKKLEELRTEFAVKPDVKSDIDRQILYDSAYLSLLKEKAYLQSRALMAETDSIYMTINLADSTSNLEISGVTVHSAKISSYNLSGIFTKEESPVLAMLSIPFSISNSIATIKKEPVMIKLAPKDTSEYKPDIIPDTSVVEPVNYILEMTNGTRIYVYQEENNAASDRHANFSFDLKDRLKNTWIMMKSVARLKVPEYHPFIKIRIPRADGKIIYRAIPRNGQVSIHT